MTSCRTCGTRSAGAGIICAMTDERLTQSDEGARACPFIAFEGDQDHRSERPDYRHRCFAAGQPEPRALPHQERYCLSASFAECPMFLDWARQEAAAVVAVGRPATADAGAEPGVAPIGAPAFLAGRARSTTPEIAPPPAPRAADLTGGMWQPEIERREDSRKQTATASARAVTLDTTPGSPAGPDRPVWDKTGRGENFPRVRPMGRQRGAPPLFLTMLALAVIVVALLVYPILTSQKGSGGGGSRTAVPTATLDESPSAEATETPSAEATYLTHVVQKGEYLQSIAQRYGVSVADVLALNNISDPNKIYPGQVLKIPPRSSKSPTPAPTSSPSPTARPSGS